MTALEATQRDIEAILFACGEPVEALRLAEALQTEQRTVELLIERIRDRYQAAGSPLDIIRVGAAYQMCTMPEYGEVVRKALELKRAATLSQAALEVLAIVAYNQPVTRALAEQVRGVDCSTLIRSLCEKELIEEAGRMNIPGKPIVYRTTANFLRCFGLAGLEQLPTLPTTAAEAPEADETEQLTGQIDFFEEL
jgi:segregation and condensation protein B